MNMHSTCALTEDEVDELLGGLEALVEANENVHWRAVVATSLYALAGCWFFFISILLILPLNIQ